MFIVIEALSNSSIHISLIEILKNISLVIAHRTGEHAIIMVPFNTSEYLLVSHLKK